MERKIVILLIMTLPLPVFWWFVKDINEQYDWFLFSDFSQTPKWYIHYTSYHFENVIKSWIVYEVCNKFMSKKLANLVFAFVLLAAFRLVEYWLFRHHVPMIPVMAVMLVYSLYIYGKK